MVAAIMPPGEEGEFEVLHDVVVIRSAPSTKSAAVSVAKKGEVYEGLPLVVDGAPWLRLSQAALEKHRLHPPKGVDLCWLLIDGRALGLGELLRRRWKPGAAQAATAQVAKPAPIDDAAAAGSNEDRRLAAACATGPRGEYVVLHDRVVRRRSPTTQAPPTQVHRGGDFVEGVPYDVDGEPWLRLDAGWMLIDGAFVGLGLLLAPAADIVQDVVEWAKQRRGTDGGKGVVWTAETEHELKRLDGVARRSVDPLRCWCRHQVVLHQLAKAGLISAKDFTLGADGVADHILRWLLHRRAGLLILAEEPQDDGLPWTEDDFASFIRDQVEPLAPFACRTFAPEDVAAQRVLVIFHGGYVRGDDLESEAEVLRKWLPDLAVVLPEAPIIVDEQRELRAWWPLPIGEAVGGEVPTNNFEAPPCAVQRAAATVSWAAGRFRGLPLVLAGFSQGAMLVSQSLGALRGDSLPRGALLLSGLIAPFDLPSKVRCLALHGDADERIDVDLARAAAEHAKLAHADEGFRLEVIPGLAHDISDAVVDRVVEFIGEVAPSCPSVARQDEAAWVQEANQAKLLRWVRRISQIIVMFDDERFMSHMMVLNMVGLGPTSPSLGGGLLRYHLHDVGRGRQGIVVLFHGKVADLRRDMAPLVEAYSRLRLSVCVVDYRQKFSQFCVDATIVLEELEAIAGDSVCPVIIHACGCGAIHGIHMAIASHSYPAVLRRRLRLLVLDGAVGNFRCLPPSPTGCIATDPIGNDEKLRYIGLPLCILGGDDACCGRVLKPTGHYEVLAKAAETLAADGLLPALTLSAGVALMEGTNDCRLCPDLFQAVSDAVDGGACVPPAAVAKAFVSDVLSSADLVDPDELRKFPAEDLRRIAQSVLEAARSGEVVRRLWAARAEGEPRRGEEVYAVILGCHAPALDAHGGFKSGSAGFRQFEGAMAAAAVVDGQVAPLRDELREAFDIQRLDEQVVELERGGAGGDGLGVTLRRCHEIMDKAAARWRSETFFMDALGRAATRAGRTPAAVAATLTKELALELTAESARSVALRGTDSELEAQLNKAFSFWTFHDPSLPAKFTEVQRSIADFTRRVRMELQSRNSAVQATEAVGRDAPASELTASQGRRGPGNEVTGLGSGTAPAAVVSDIVRGGAVSIAGSETASGDGRGGGLGAFIVADNLSATVGRAAGGLGGAVVSSDDGGNMAAASGLDIGSPDAGASPVVVSVVVHIDRDLGLMSVLELPAAANVRRVKEELAKANPTAMIRLEDVRFCLPGGGRELADYESVSAALPEVELA